MAVREVLLHPHPTLKQVCRPLADEAPAELERIAADLVDTMRSFPGCVGIAAPQIDEPVRMVAVDCTGHRKVPDAIGLLVLVDPVVVRSEGSEVGREGCLSIPDFTANVRRATSISISASDPAGEPLAVETTGFEARCFLHELDHLDGLLFLDRVDSLKRDVFRRKTYQ